MTWEKALEIIVARTKHERYRYLCSDDNPDAWQRESYRQSVIEMATGQPQPITAQPAPTVIRSGCCGGAPLP